MKSSHLLLIMGALLLGQCKKQDLSPEDQLPAITQTGADTFGCLLNGQPWLPDGPIFLSYWPAYKVTYDSAKGGSLLLAVARHIDGVHDNQYIELTCDNVRQPGVYAVNGVTCGAYYYNPAVSGPCREFYNPQYFSIGATYTKGQLIITRLDTRHKIVSGTFSFSLAKPNCDTIKVTKGRFDRKYF